MTNTYMVNACSYSEVLVIKHCLDFVGTGGNDEPGVNTEVTK